MQQLVMGAATPLTGCINNVTPFTLWLLYNWEGFCLLPSAHRTKKVRGVLEVECARLCAGVCKTLLAEMRSFVTVNSGVKRDSWDKCCWALDLEARGAETRRWDLNRKLENLVAACVRVGLERKDRSLNDLVSAFHQFRSFLLRAIFKSRRPQTKAKHQSNTFANFHDSLFILTFITKANHHCYGCLALSLSNDCSHLRTHQRG